MLFTEKAKIVDRGYQTCALESTGVSFNMNLIFFPWRVPRQIEVPYVALLNLKFPSLI